MAFVLENSGTSKVQRFDWILVGGGLQNGLNALAILCQQPNAKLALVDPSPVLGGNHTWCFQRADIPGALEPWLAQLVERKWAEQTVRFERYERTLRAEYCVVPSARFAQQVEGALRRAPHAQHLTARAVRIEAREVELEEGRILTAPIVVDARGPRSLTGSEPGRDWAYQKFVGLELELAQPVCDAQVTLMDARVAQLDGFRFFYVLPMSSTRVLIEDTYYSDSPELDQTSLKQHILDYARAHGFAVRQILREEHGVLPIPLRMSALRYATAGVITAGYAGGYVHPTTGYTFAVALRLARHLAARRPEQARDAAFDELQAELTRQQRFCVALNQLLFRGFEPQLRVNVLSRFYRLPEALVSRFFALASSRLDWLRILSGRPPRGFSLRRYLYGWRAPVRQFSMPFVAVSPAGETDQRTTAPKLPQEGTAA